VEYWVLVNRDGEITEVDPLGIACCSWHPTEDPDLDGDEEEIELELDLHERGWRMCQAYSRREPNGEFGHITESRLLAISQEDFEDGLRLLRGRELAAYDEHICNAAARRPGLVAPASTRKRQRPELVDERCGSRLVVACMSESAGGRAFGDAL
jgi:hypothetical protein